jgi:hypothetical protein
MTLKTQAVEWQMANNGHEQPRNIKTDAENKQT